MSKWRPMPYVSLGEEKTGPDKPVHDIMLSHQRIFGRTSFVNPPADHIITLFSMLSNVCFISHVQSK